MRPNKYLLGFDQLTLFRPTYPFAVVGEGTDEDPRANLHQLVYKYYTPNYKKVQQKFMKLL